MKIEIVTPTFFSVLSKWTILRESIPRQADKFGGSQGERGLEFSRRKKGQTFFFLHIP